MNMISGKTLREKLPTKISKASPVFARLSQLLVSNRLHYFVWGLFTGHNVWAVLRKDKYQLLSRQTCPAKSNLLLLQIFKCKQCWYEPWRTKGRFFFLNIKYVYIHCLTRESCLSIASYTDAGVLSANAVSDYCTFQNPWLQFKKLNFPSACFVQVNFSHWFFFTSNCLWLQDII